MNKLRILFAAVALTASVAGLAADANVAGTWTLSMESPQGKRESTLTLTQKGSELAGTIKGARGENPVTGNVSGNNVTISYTIKFGENEMKMQYKGTVDGANMTGNMVTPRGEQPFTGKKQ